MTEAINVANEEFGLEAVQALFSESGPPSAREAAETILDAVETFAGEVPQFDDLTCMTLRIADE